MSSTLPPSLKRKLPPSTSPSPSSDAQRPRLSNTPSIPHTDASSSVGDHEMEYLDPNGIRYDPNDPEFEFMADPSLSEKEKRKRARAVRNRYSAQLSRNRKKDYLQSLESEVESLRAENAKLRSSLLATPSSSSASRPLQLGVGVQGPPSPSISFTSTTSTLNQHSNQKINSFDFKFNPIVTPPHSANMFDKKPTALSSISSASVKMDPEDDQRTGHGDGGAGNKYSEVDVEAVLVENVELRAKIDILEKLLMAFTAATPFAQNHQGLVREQSFSLGDRLVVPNHQTSTSFPESTTSLPNVPAALVNPAKPVEQPLQQFSPSNTLSPRLQVNNNVVVTPSSSEILARHPAAMTTSLYREALQRALISKRRRAVSASASTRVYQHLPSTNYSSRSAETHDSKVQEQMGEREWELKLEANRARVDVWRRGIGEQVVLAVG